jgi:hypothetical protein
VLVLVGGAALLLRVTGEGSPVATTPQIDSLSSLTWSRVPHDEAVFGGPFGQSMFDVTVGGPGLVAVGESGRPGDFDAAVWTSPDGITWSRVPHNEAVFGGIAYQGMLSVTVGGPGLVAVGSDGSHDRSAAVWTSPDGITWSRVPHNEAVFGGAAMSSVGVGGPGLVAVGSDGDPQTAIGNEVVWTSPDGITWSRVPDNEEIFGGETSTEEIFGSAGVEDVIAVGPGLVAVGVDWHTEGGNDAAVWTSPNGITWTRVPHDEAVFGGQPQVAMLSVTVGGPGLVAVGESGWEEDFDAAVWIAGVED